VRPAEARDLPRAATLFDAYRQFYGASPDVPAAQAFLAARMDRGESVLLVAEEGPSMLGFTQLFPLFSSVGLGPIFLLNDLFVTADARRRGVGSRLLDAAATHAQRAGALRIELSTHRTNAAASRLYAAHGYVVDTAFTHLSLALTPLPPS
jgi:ribosomal protein S18 acetylase RimI-like enzyme